LPFTRGGDEETQGTVEVVRAKSEVRRAKEEEQRKKIKGRRTKVRRLWAKNPLYFVVGSSLFVVDHWWFTEKQLGRELNL
jgi:hypothetical protein